MMEGASDIWISFIRTVGIFFIVIALPFLLLHIYKRLSGAAGNLKNSRDMIRVLSMHHFSPREKVVLVEVMDEILLIGITPGKITRLMQLEKSAKEQSAVEAFLNKASSDENTSPSGVFAKILNRKRTVCFSEKKTDKSVEKGGDHGK